MFCAVGDMTGGTQIMEDRVERVVKESFKLNDEKVDKNWTSDDIEGWDSMGHLNLILALEKEFGVRFEIEEIFQIRNIADISTVLKRKFND